MEKIRIETDDAPKAVGPYSQGIAAGNMVFVSGQLGIDKDTGKLVEGGIVPETKTTLENMKAILAKEGLTLNDVVKTTVFVSDLAEYPEMNKVYAEYFEGSVFPARETVQAKIVLGAKVEISCIAVKK
ncbi:MAG: Rid family detoxifying hydrolase [Nanoarchaeota archaeon]|nr:Rid family detoxifying hydrolase [Nanoarchaeota archaeon]